VASETGFRRLFFENPQAMWVLDAETHGFLAVNDAAIATYGYSAEEFAGLTLAEVRHDATHLTADFGRAREEGRHSVPATTYETDGSSTSRSPPQP